MLIARKSKLAVLMHLMRSVLSNYDGLIPALRSGSMS